MAERLSIEDALARLRSAASPMDTESCPVWAHAGQREAWASEAQTVVVVAGAQGGKSCLSPHWILREIRRTASLANSLGASNHLFVGPTLDILQKQAIPQVRALLQDDLGLGEMRGEFARPRFVFSSHGAKRLGINVPAIIYFAYANDSSNLESITALSCVWDECGQRQNKEESFYAVLRRLSVARSNGFGRMLMTSTPYDWTWFKRLVVDQQGEDISYHTWPTWANPQQDEQVIRGLLSTMPEWKWKMFYEGSWTKPLGLVYTCFEPSVMTFDGGVPSGVVGVGVDFGSANTAAVVARESSGVWHVTGEYHGASGHASAHVERVRELTGGKESFAFGGAASEDNIRRQFWEAGLVVRKPPVTGAESVAYGISCVFRMFSDGRLKISSKCTKLLSQLASYRYQIDGDGEKVLDVIVDKSEYHLLDALRYFCVGVSGRVEPKVVYSRFGGPGAITEDELLPQRRF